MKRKSFTLIEMLIVVVIIGILSAVIVPRLQTQQARARDTKRKADVNQIAGGLILMMADAGNLRQFSGERIVNRNSRIGIGLIVSGSYLLGMPTDPRNDQWYLGTHTGCCVASPVIVTGASYAFTSLSRKMIENNAFAVSAKMEIDGISGNWVTASGATNVTGAGGGNIYNNADASRYIPACTIVDRHNGPSTPVPGGRCLVDRVSADVRYLYIY